MKLISPTTLDEDLKNQRGIQEVYAPDSVSYSRL